MKTMKSTILLVTFGILFTAVIWAAARQNPPPLVMLQNTASRMLSQLDRYQGRLKGNDQLLYSIVRRVLLPHFDLQSMSASVVGRYYWQQASPTLRRQFIKEFTFYVVRTYSSPLSSYDGEKIRFYPIRGYRASQSRVQVNSDILQKNGPPVRLSYRVRRAGNRWLIYDFSVEGVSLIQNYRSQFAGTLRRGGLAKLTQDLRTRNR